MNATTTRTTEYEVGRLIERPDGFYWQAKDGGREYGPFASLLDAETDMMNEDNEEALEPGETLQEAEAELGIADWIDEGTGAPAQQDELHLEE